VRAVDPGRATPLLLAGLVPAGGAAPLHVLPCGAPLRLVLRGTMLGPASLGAGPFRTMPFRPVPPRAMALRPVPAILAAFGPRWPEASARVAAFAPLRLGGRAVMGAERACFAPFAPSGPVGPARMLAVHGASPYYPPDIDSASRSSAGFRAGGRGGLLCIAYWTLTGTGGLK
jgi:hypothetical protein